MFNQNLLNMKNIFLLLLGLSLGIQLQAQIKRVALSPLQVLKQSIADTDVTITYSRPAMRDRKIFGGLVPYNEKWRTGANRNSVIEFSRDVMVGDSLLKAGSYAIITVPSEKQWEIMFYEDISSWEVPDPWDEELVAVSQRISSEKLSSQVQSMTFVIEDVTYESCVLSLLWEETKVSIPIQILTEEQMMQDINKVLSGPAASDYYTAALYREGTGVDIEQALVWIDKAIELREPDSYWDYLLKSKILVKLRRYETAKEIAQKGLEIANDYGYKYGIKLMKEQVAVTQAY